jgi:hypothetical protein
MPGDGKSTMLLDDAARLTRGTLEGEYFSTPVSVAIATAEDAVASVVVPRLMAAGADLERVHIVCLASEATGSLILTPDKVSEIAGLVKAEEIRLLVFDPLVAFLPRAIDTHRDAAVRQILAPLARHAEDAELAVVAVIHLNKGQVQDVLYRVSGSIGFVGAARSVLLVARDPESPDGATRILAHPKCNLAPKAPSRRFTIVGHEIKVDGETIRTSHIDWGDEVPELTSSDLIGAQATDDRSALDEAIEFLKAQLIATPAGTEVTGIYRESRRHGIADRTLQRAKSHLHVKSCRDGKTRTWSWQLPEVARAPALDGGALASDGEAASDLSACDGNDLEAIAKNANGKSLNDLGDLDEARNGLDL